MCIVWFFYPEFSGCAEGSLWCSTAYWLTQSAGKIGTLVIVLFASLVFALGQPSGKEKIHVFLRSFFVLILILSAFGVLNENVIKPALKYARPSHAYIITHTKSGVNLDSLYTIDLIKRKLFFQELLASDTVNFKAIDRRILNHWVEEAGYSFPSGHSFNAFMLGSILAFSIYHSGIRKKWLYVIPLFWACMVALSRVAIGAHSALDVSVGAGMGLIISHTLLVIRLTRRLITPKGLDMKI